jgi:hypothetical protein
MTNPCPVNTSSAQIWSLLNQRRQQALYNVPLVRLNLVSPYKDNNFTKDQLDMRRKAEILKYKNQNSQTNNLTKAQKWSQMVSGKYSANITPFIIESNSDNTNCAADDLIPTLTSACDVPGHPIYLTYDPRVPLYNYANNQTFAILNNQTTSMWTAYTSSNDADSFAATTIGFTLNYTNDTNIGVIVISNLLTQPITTYTITLPIFIWARGLCIGQVNPIRISILSITLNVYYNDISILTSPISNSFNGVDSAYHLSSMTIDANQTKNQIFYAIQYAGMLSIPNFTLNTQTGNVYTLMLTFNYDFIDTNTNKSYVFTSGVSPNILPTILFEAGVFCNLGLEKENICIIPATQENISSSALVSLPSAVPYSSGYFNAV